MPKVQLRSVSTLLEILHWDHGPALMPRQIEDVSTLLEILLLVWLVVVGF